MQPEPTSQAEREVQEAAFSMIERPDSHGISRETFLSLCRRAPKYAAHLLDVYHTDLMYRGGHVLAETAMLAEWELRGATAFFESHRFEAGEHAEFIRRQLFSHPQDFSLDDLRAIIQNYRHQKLRDMASSEMESRLTASANGLPVVP